MSLTLLLWAFQSNRPVRGGTFGSRHLPPRPYYFNPPAPCGAGPRKVQRNLHFSEFQSTRPMRGGTSHLLYASNLFHISIHPPHAGRDALRWCNIRVRAISIHPPRAGRDPGRPLSQKEAAVFQSTRPVRGGTVGHFQVTPGILISIHPPRAGRDVSGKSTPLQSNHFNPPAPCGAGLWPYRRKIACCGISIHPPRAGRDQRIQKWAQ